jgi:nicotinamidase-related amidase
MILEENGVNSMEDFTTAALLIIDVQQGFDKPYWGHRNNPTAENKIRQLLGKWRQAHRPVYHVQHISNDPQSPLHPSSEGFKIKEEVKPVFNEPLIQKRVNSAFIGTELESMLRKDGIKKVVIVGLTTNHCVETTARMAGNLGFETFVVSDATATFERKGPDGKTYPADLIHAVSLTNIHKEFATIVDTEYLLGS